MAFYGGAMQSSMIKECQVTLSIRFPSSTVSSCVPIWIIPLSFEGHTDKQKEPNDYQFKSRIPGQKIGSLTLGRKELRKGYLVYLQVIPVTIFKNQGLQQCNDS